MRHTVYETLVTDDEKAHKHKEKLVLGRDPIEEDIKKGLSLEEMRKRLDEKSHYERIMFLEKLLSRKSPGLPADTMANLGTIRTESYRFFGDECMGAGDFASAAEAYSKAGEDGLAGKAWRQAGDSYIEEAEKGRKEGGAEGKQGAERKEGRKKGKIAVSLYEKAAESYENAKDVELAKSAWRKAGDDYLAMADAGDSRCLNEALRCYSKANDGRMTGYVGLMTGMPLKDVEQNFSKSNVKKDDYVLMARELMERQYYHAARFLYDLAGEKELARMVAEMQSKSVKK